MKQAPVGMTREGKWEVPRLDKHLTTGLRLAEVTPMKFFTPISNPPSTCTFSLVNDKSETFVRIL